VQPIDALLQHGDISHVAVFGDAFPQACIYNNVLH
jgi:hypothetical protein